jgi:hypothetical protein
MGEPVLGDAIINTAQPSKELSSALYEYGGSEWISWRLVGQI